MLGRRSKFDCSLTVMTVTWRQGESWGPMKILLYLFPGTTEFAPKLEG